MTPPKRLLSCLLAAALLAGCAIHQTVKPVAKIDTREICLVERPEVRATFAEELRGALAAKGFEVRMLPPSSSTRSCPLTATYTANWRWDLALYMAYAEVRVFADGRPAGEAIYDSTRGGGNLGKFIDAKQKVRELVNQLFPETAAR